MTKILIDEEVVKQALDALSSLIFSTPYAGKYGDAITALRSALQAEKVEPVAEMTRGWPYPSDEELLELAAKAAGIEYDSEQDGCAVYYVPYLTRYYNWNPLTDDGDALRLAVKLHIDIRHFMYRDNRMDCLVDRLGSGFAEDVDPNDPYAATRRAIVRAAAEIGKGMK